MLLSEKVIEEVREMNLRQLEYFAAVAECGSFTKAAAQQYITQTAITQQIRELEKTLGVELFDRSTRPVTLTPAGSLFLHEAKAILERMDQAMQRVREVSVGMSGKLKIGYTKGYERSDLSERLRSFHHAYPNILLSCYRNDTDRLAFGLLQNEYDIIFTWDSTGLLQDEAIGSVLVRQYPLMAVVYEGHPLAARRFLTRRELKLEKIIYATLSERGDSRGDARFLELYREAGYEPNVIYLTNDMENVLMMVAAAEGISILPAYMTNKLTDGGELRFIPLKGEEEHIEIVAAWKKDNTNPVLKQFVQQMER